MAFRNDTLIFAHKDGLKNFKVIWDADELATLKEILESGQQLKLEKLGLSGLLRVG